MPAVNQKADRGASFAAMWKGRIKKASTQLAEEFLLQAPLRLPIFKKRNWASAPLLREQNFPLLSPAVHLASKAALKRGAILDAVND